MASTLLSIPTGYTRDNSFFAPYVKSDKVYGATKQKLAIITEIGNKWRGVKTAPLDINYGLHYKIPIGGRGQSNAVRFVGEYS